jgi:hypothetical protein
MAQQADSVNYADILEVKLEEYGANNKLLRTLQLLRDSSIGKNPGLFATAPNYVYRTQPGIRVATGNRYELNVRNTVTDSLVTASTEVVDSIIIETPVGQPSVEIKWYAGNSVSVKWLTTEEGFLYQLVIRFHFTEENTVTGQQTPMYIDWTFPELRKSEAQGGALTLPVVGEEFYRFVAASLQQKSDTKRKIGALDFNFIAAGEDFSTYFEVNKPPTGLNQTLPTYTNVEGGIGVFSSRLTQSVCCKNMDKQSRDSLIFGSYTGLLGFE